MSCIETGTLSARKRQSKRVAFPMSIVFISKHSLINTRLAKTTQYLFFLPAINEVTDYRLRPDFRSSEFRVQTAYFDELTLCLIRSLNQHWVCASKSKLRIEVNTLNLDGLNIQPEAGFAVGQLLTKCPNLPRLDIGNNEAFGTAKG